MWFLGVLEHQRKTYAERAKPLIDLHTRAMQEKPRISAWTVRGDGCSITGTQYWVCRGADLRGYGITPEGAYHDWWRRRCRFDEDFRMQMAWMPYTR